MNNPDYQLLASVVRIKGGTPKAVDNVRDLYFKWRQVRLGNPPADDGVYDFLWDLTEADGFEPPYAVDSIVDLLRKLAGLPPGTQTNESLQFILSTQSGGSFSGTVDSTLVTVDSTTLTADRT